MIAPRSSLLLELQGRGSCGGSAAAGAEVDGAAATPSALHPGSAAGARRLPGSQARGSASAGSRCCSWWKRTCGAEAGWGDCIALFLVDALAFLALILLEGFEFMAPVASAVHWSAIPVAVAWRALRALRPETRWPLEASPAPGVAQALPYTCGYVRKGDTELFIVATLHISPRSPEDARLAIAAAEPHLVAVELDDERLGSRRDAEGQQLQLQLLPPAAAAGAAGAAVMDGRGGTHRDSGGSGGSGGSGDAEGAPRVGGEGEEVVEASPEPMHWAAEAVFAAAAVRSQIADLQPIRFTRREEPPESIALHAQRAVWNAEWTGETIRGEVVFDRSDEFGIRGRPPLVAASSSSVAWAAGGAGGGARGGARGRAASGHRAGGRLALVRRGAPDGEFADFAYKAHLAHRAGADALLVIDDRPELLPARLGPGRSLRGELRLAWRTGRCGFPPVPVLLLPRADGERLREMCRSSPVEGEFRVLPDNHPRRTLRRRLCQGCALMSSGIGILYGIIAFFAVDVGGEFEAAIEAAEVRGIPSACIDVDMNDFWSRLGRAVLPTPANMFASCRAWLALPRVLLGFLLPPQGSIDTLGSTVLHLKAFTLRIWLAFAAGGIGAALVTSKLLEAFVWGGARAAELSGAIEAEEREELQIIAILLIHLYLLPRVHYAVAASRDLTMLENIKAEARAHGARRVVAVMGAGHANGVLALARRPVGGL